MWATCRCYNMFVFAVGFSFPEGRLSHLLATDYMLSRDSPLWHAHTQKWCWHSWMYSYTRHNFIESILHPHPSLGCDLCGCVFFRGPQTQTATGRGGGGDVRGDGWMEWGRALKRWSEREAVITVCSWFNRCFCSWLDLSAYKSYITPKSRHFSHACQTSSSLSQELFFGRKWAACPELIAGQHCGVKSGH